eukprot:5050219-Lingulodinium_polyedra.AAC.1
MSCARARSAQHIKRAIWAEQDDRARGVTSDQQFSAVGSLAEKFRTQVEEEMVATLWRGLAASRRRQPHRTPGPSAAQ